MSDKERQLSELRKAQREEAEGRISSDSRERLKKIAAKKFQTCFIFALAEFETAFGKELWGHNMPEESLTSEQKANKTRWQQVRTNILNKGHMQARALMAELDLHETIYNGYKVRFLGKDKEE